jgi:23S rRNA pseudouridine955/2504/2580 synthase
MSVTFVVAGEGGRPDHVLRARHPTVDRTLALALLKQGRIHVDGVRADLRTRCSPGQSVVVDVKAERLGPIHHAPYTVLHQADGVIVVDKAVGIAMHPGTGVPDDDDDESEERPLSALLGSRFMANELPGDVDPLDGPSFLGRLDRPTSGLVVAALTRAALATIEPVWRRGEIRKEYLVIARGRPRSQRIEVPLVGRRPHQRGKALVEEARTDIHVVATTTTGPALTLLVAELFSGRTHQIRRHLKAIGHPLVGDHRYGARGDDGQGGLMLHAWRLRRAPGVEDAGWPSLLPTTLEAPWPERLLEVLQTGGIDVDAAIAAARALP